MALVQKHISKKKGRFYCIFVNYAKAFDSINLKKLWQAFRRQNIDGKFLLALQSVYSKLKSCVKVENRLTEYFACNIGTRQGCVASPIIFSIFINDLVPYLRENCGNGIFVSNEINDLFALMYADDVAGFSDTINRLQKLIKFSSYFQ